MLNHDLNLFLSARHPGISERDLVIASYLHMGQTQSNIANNLDLSEARISQIINSNDFTGIRISIVKYSALSSAQDRINDYISYAADPKIDINTRLSACKAILDNHAEDISRYSKLSTFDICDTTGRFKLDSNYPTIQLPALYDTLETMRRDDDDIYPAKSKIVAARYIDRLLALLDMVDAERERGRGRGRGGVLDNEGDDVDLTSLPDSDLQKMIDG